MIATFMVKSATSGALPLHLGVLAYPGCSAWVASSVLEAFALARVLQPAVAPQARAVAPAWTAPGRGPVQASAGIVIRVPARATLPQVLVVPPMWHTSMEDFGGRLEALRPQIAFIRRLAARGVPVASVCSGVALLAAAGLLDGRVATGCWWLEPTLRKLYPQVRWQFAQTLVHDGPVVTAGSGSAYAALVFDLLARTSGRGLAARTAQFLGIEPNRDPQSRFAPLAPAAGGHADPLVAAFEQEVRRHTGGLHMDVEHLAGRLHTSARTLYRRVRAATGHSPHRLVQMARLERAKSLLADTRLAVEEICERCGWRDVSSFRKLFAREVGQTPAAWRKAFSQGSVPPRPG